MYIVLKMNWKVLWVVLVDTWFEKVYMMKINVQNVSFIQI